MDIQPGTLPTCPHCGGKADFNNDGEMDRLESFVSGTKGKRLTYKALIQ